jgi:hypothetical protein
LGVEVVDYSDDVLRGLAYNQVVKGA